MAKKKVSLLELLQHFMELFKNKEVKKIVKDSNEQMDKFREFRDKKNK